MAFNILVRHFFISVFHLSPTYPPT